MSRVRMTQRADIERDTATGENAYGHDPAPVWTVHVSNAPCWVWSRQRRETVDGRKTVIIEDLRAMVPVDADIKTGDRFASVKDRRGQEVLAGPLTIETLQYKRLHIEAALERVT